MPVYNERATVREAMRRAQAALQGYALEIIVVDDGSTDGTAGELRHLDSEENVRCLAHPRNQGKGAALRTCFAQATGDIVVVQDADLEYDPRDIPRLIQPIVDGKADAVYGSRFHGQSQRVHLFWRRLANGVLTLLSNVLNNLNLSDMETGYKAFRADVTRKLRIRENRFGVEPEITAKLARMGCRIYEVPVSYSGRDYAEGKKIGVRDALWAVWCIVRYRIAD